MPTSMAITQLSIYINTLYVWTKHFFFDYLFILTVYPALPDLLTKPRPTKIVLFFYLFTALGCQIQRIFIV